MAPDVLAHAERRELLLGCVSMLVGSAGMVPCLKALDAAVLVQSRDSGTRPMLSHR